MQLIARTKIVLFVAALGVAGACNRGPDPKDQIDKALKDAKLDQVNVDWDREAHIAHLKGTVDTPTDKQRAEEVAASAVGTSGRVLNEVTVRGANDRSADDLDGRIRSNLKKLIDDDPNLKDRDVNFDVNNGVVTVKGEVRSAAEKQRVTELVREQPGVRDMANALEIKPQK